MNRQDLVFGGVILGVIIMGVLLAPINAVPSIGDIPPTRAFQKIFTNGDNVTATKYNANLNITSGANMLIEAFFSNSTLRFSATAPTLYMEQIANVTSIGCALGQALTVNASAIWACSNVGTGDVTGAANVGTGTGLVFRDETTGTLNLRTIKQNGNVTITTVGDEILISATGGTASSVKIDNQTVARKDWLVGFNNLTGDWTSRTFGLYNTTCTGNNFIKQINNLTGFTVCGTPSATGGSGFTTITKISSLGDASILFSNSSNKAVHKQLAGTPRNLTISGNSTGLLTFNLGDRVLTHDKFKIDNATVNLKQRIVGINNQTGDITKQTFAINNQTVSRTQWLVGINNQTGVNTVRTFAANTFTCSAGQFVSSYSNTTGAYSCTTPSGGGATVLAANVTATTSISVDTVVWTIPLTANSGNQIDGVIIGSSATSGNAVRGAANVTSLQSRGYCQWTQVSTTTANAIDNLVLNTVLTGRATNTGETAWIAAANQPMPISFSCSIQSGATPGNLKIWITPEVASSTIHAKAGSYYIKGP